MDDYKRIELDEGIVIRIVPEEWDFEHANPRECDQLGTMFCWHPRYELGDEQFSENFSWNCPRCGGDGWTANNYAPATLAAFRAGPEFDCPDCEGDGQLYAHSMDDIARYLRTVEKATNILPLYLYDHSGITMRAGEPLIGDPADNDMKAKGRFMGDDAGWDTSMVGFIYTTAKRIEELCGRADYCPKDWDGTAREWIDKNLDNEVKEYAMYLEGRVYGYIIERASEDPDEEGEHLDSCWGFLGEEYVEEEARMSAKSEVENARKSRLRAKLALLTPERKLVA